MNSKKPANTRKRLRGLTVKDGFMLHPFDLTYQVQTSGLIAGRDLAAHHPHDRHNTAYYGIAPSIFRRLIARWRETSPTQRIGSTTFIDFGAGMGRAMLLASRIPFREVIGVELHSQLVRTAQRNIDHWQSLGLARSSMRVLEVDATTFAFPENPCVAYLFNPFGAPVLRQLLRSMAQSFAARPGQLDVLYVNHEHEAVMKRTAGFRQLWSGSIAMSRADAAADSRIIHNQPEGEYASSGDEACSIYRWIGYA
jgi:predicted RNA methylase